MCSVKRIKKQCRLLTLRMPFYWITPTSRRHHFAFHDSILGSNNSTEILTQFCRFLACKIACLSLKVKLFCINSWYQSECQYKATINGLTKSLWMTCLSVKTLNAIIITYNAERWVDWRAADLYYHYILYAAKACKKHTIILCFIETGVIFL